MFLIILYQLDIDFYPHEAFTYLTSVPSEGPTFDCFFSLSFNCLGFLISLCYLFQRCRLQNTIAAAYASTLTLFLFQLSYTAGQYFFK